VNGNGAIAGRGLQSTVGLCSVTILALVLGGCAGKTEQERSTDATITKTTAEGPVTLSLSVTPDTQKPTQRDSMLVGVVVQVLGDRGVVVQPHDYRAALTAGDRPFQYRIAEDNREDAVPTADGRLRWERRVTLEFFLPGTYELPPAAVSFVDARGGVAKTGEAEDWPGPEEQILTTEPLTVEAGGTHAAALTDAELREIPRADTVELPRQWGTWVWLGPILGLAVLVAIRLVTGVRSGRAAARQPAHAWAWEQMAALRADDLIAKGRVREFYFRISGIVRGYIERRFSVHAPDMTTEEFLTAVATDVRFGGELAVELDRFLHGCDLVKFARHEPGSGECDTAMRAAEDFVEQTRADRAAGDPHARPYDRTEDRAA
jgi:hypothetical protein